jgi:hypothetical protein
LVDRPDNIIIDEYFLIYELVRNFQERRVYLMGEAELLLDADEHPDTNEDNEHLETLIIKMVDVCTPKKLKIIIFNRTNVWNSYNFDNNRRRHLVTLKDYIQAF